MAQMVKNPPTMQETWVRSLGHEDPLERNGYPLQYSCLENSTDRGAWQSTVHDAESDTAECLTLSLSQHLKAKNRAYKQLANGKLINKTTLKNKSSLCHS